MTTFQVDMSGIASTSSMLVGIHFRKSSDDVMNYA